MSIFANLKTEKDVGRLKRAIMRDPFYNSKILEIRKRINNNAEAHGAMPTNPEMLMLFENMLNDKEIINNEEQKLSAAEINSIRQILKRLKVRSNSGVAVVSLLTKPYTCPGRCIYCPTEKNMPKSYLSREPAAARALTNRFDPYKQITMRLKALTMNGHPVDKVEMIFIGGTFNYYPRDYQEWFTKEAFRACNNWGLAKTDMQYIAEDYTLINQTGDTANNVLSLNDLQTLNEKVMARIIGLSIETRPDYVNALELKWLRYLGVTKVEIGVQHLDNRVLEFNKREMTEEAIAETSELLRDYGFKTVYHMMPNLPGSNEEMDVKMFRQLYNGLYHHPDMMKIYPCMTLRGSTLYKLYTQKKIDYKPYDDEILTRVLADCEREVKPYTRLIRVIRDIPADYIIAGSRKSNLREMVDAYLKDSNIQQVDIRAREIRDGEVDPNDYDLTETVYETARGTEYFLQFENKKENILAGFLRLRIPNTSPAPSPLTPLQDLERGTTQNASVSLSGPFPQSLGEGEEGGRGSNWGIAKWLVKSKDELSKIKILNKEKISQKSCHNGSCAKCVCNTIDNEESSTGNVVDADGNFVSLDAIDDTLRGAALVRELHVYGTMKRVGEEGNQSQHTGMGKRLLARAEEIALANGFHKVAIISGVGVRDYYRKRGYHLESTYMVKEI